VTRAFTLIELMICIAVIGIISMAAGTNVMRMQQVAVAEVQRERARLLLDYRGDHLAKGTSPDPAVEARLTERLPDAAVEHRKDGPVTTVDVVWRDPFGRVTRQSLTVFTR